MRLAVCLALSVLAFVLPFFLLRRKKPSLRLGISAVAAVLVLALSVGLSSPPAEQGTLDSLYFSQFRSYAPESIDCYSSDRETDCWWDRETPALQEVYDYLSSLSVAELSRQGAAQITGEQLYITVSGRKTVPQENATWYPEAIVFLEFSEQDPTLVRLSVKREEETSEARLYRIEGAGADLDWLRSMAGSAHSFTA